MVGVSGTERAKTVAEAVRTLAPDSYETLAVEYQPIVPGHPWFVEFEGHAEIVERIVAHLRSNPRARIVVSGAPGVGKRMLVRRALAKLEGVEVVWSTQWVRVPDQLVDVRVDREKRDAALARLVPEHFVAYQDAFQRLMANHHASEQDRLRKDAAIHLDLAFAAAASSLCSVFDVRNSFALPNLAALNVLHSNFGARTVVIVDAAFPSVHPPIPLDDQIFVHALSPTRALVEQFVAPRVDLDVFAEVACLDVVADASGGNLGDILAIAQRAATYTRDHITLDAIVKSARSLALKRLGTLDESQRRRLARIHRTHQITPVDADLLLAGALIGTDTHAELHPLIREAIHPTRAALHRLELEGVGPAAALALELAPRINLILGDNGLGKTFLLDVAWWSLTGSWPGRPAWPAPESRTQARIRVIDADARVVESHFDARLEAWPRGAEWPRARTPVVYARIDGGVSIWDPLRNDLHGISEPESVPAQHFTARELELGLVLPDGSSRCNGLFADWDSWRHDDPELFERFIAVLRGLFGPEGSDEQPRPGPAVQLGKHDQKRVPTLEFGHGRVPLAHLSAGMKRIVAIAYALAWTWDAHRRAAQSEGSEPANQLVILVDEVESHLHPRWQRHFLPALLRVIEGLAGVQVQLLATSHSPLVLASLAPHFEAERDRLFHLDVEGRQVELRELPWANFGDANGWLTSVLFGLDQPGSVEAERAIADARACMRGEGGDPAAIQAALARSVAPEHPIWDGWRPFMRAREP